MSVQFPEEAIEALARLVDQLHADLGVLSYYNLLGVAPDATPEVLRQAFHARALMLHPDRFYSLPDKALRDRIGAVYKRVAEGFRVVNNPTQRAAYDRLLHAGQMRYTREAAEALAKQDQQDQAVQAGRLPPITNLQARQFYDMGKAELRRQDFRSAVSYLEQALSMEPGAPKIRAVLDEALRLQRLYGG